MTKKDLKVIVQIMTTADGGCPVCAANLINMFAEYLNVNSYTLGLETIPEKDYILNRLNGSPHDVIDYNKQLYNIINTELGKKDNPK